MWSHIICRWLWKQIFFVHKGASLASRLGMQMQQAGFIYSTTFYTTETLWPAAAWMVILFNISHSSSSKRIASFDRARVSVIMSELNQYTVHTTPYDVFQLTDTARQTRDACAAMHEPNTDGLAKESHFRAADARYCICIPSRDAKDRPCLEPHWEWI